MGFGLFVGESRPSQWVELARPGRAERAGVETSRWMAEVEYSYITLIKKQIYGRTF
jgi:hypothetical protein